MDYIDKYSISVCTKKQITAQEVYDMIFSDYPPLVRLLFNIRNKIVKRFGLKRQSVSAHPLNFTMLWDGYTSSS